MNAGKSAIISWVLFPSWDTFKNLYHHGFNNNPTGVFKVWRIVRNTVTGKYFEYLRREVY